MILGFIFALHYFSNFFFFFFKIMLYFLYFYTTSWVGPCGYYLYNVPIPESYLSINLTSIIWWLADYNLSLISDCCCCDGGTHPKYIDGRHHAVFMVWGNLSSLLFPDYTLYIYDIHLLLVVLRLLASFHEQNLYGNCCIQLLWYDLTLFKANWTITSRK